MSAGLPSAAIASAYRAACLAELDALKPGNVHRHAGGHGMEAALFETSAEVSAEPVARRGARVGTRVLAAVEATWSAVGMNTNLGIVLLAAPLAAAAERAGPAGTAAPAGAGKAALRDSVGHVLSGLVEADAADVFQAIAHASPGGLGTHGEHDVRAAPRIGLLDAMRLAATEDRVARQYAESFADIFDIGLAALAAAPADSPADMGPALYCFLAFATAFPDSHVGRKYGAPAALALQDRMRGFRDRFFTLDGEEERRAALLAFDRDLKAEKLNPGTSADLTVASIFAALLAGQLEDWGRG